MTELDESQMHFVMWKMLVWIEDILFDCNYMAFWKKQISSDSTKVSDCQRFRGKSYIICITNESLVNILKLPTSQYRKDRTLNK